MKCGRQQRQVRSRGVDELRSISGGLIAVLPPVRVSEIYANFFKNHPILFVEITTANVDVARM
jgi:hypothetical protein